jgi:hypothetical protein
LTGIEEINQLNGYGEDMLREVIYKVTNATEQVIMNTLTFDNFLNMNSVSQFYDERWQQYKHSESNWAVPVSFLPRLKR